MKRLLAIALAIGLLTAAAPAGADHLDGPLFADTAANGRMDIGEVYVFRSPTNANNTVLMMTVSPFAGVTTPSSFQPGARYEILVDQTGDYRADLTFRATFGAPSADGSQRVTLRCVPAYRCRNRGLIARGRTRTNLSLPAFRGTFRAGIHDDPFFFDHVGWEAKAATGAATFPRAPGVAVNHFGPNHNILAIVLEVRSDGLGAVSSAIAVWARTVNGGTQQDRAGRALINTTLIPPMPRNNLSRGERRTLFNQASPNLDLATFGDDMRAVYQGFWSRTPADANALTSIFLPDVLPFQIGNPNGFGTFISAQPFVGTVLGNGRRLRDDTSDVMLNITSNGATTTDNVTDDNGTRITDGNMGTIAAFPYIGAPN